MACGTVCAFHVGGAAAGESRWEFFVGDLPHAHAAAPAAGSSAAGSGPDGVVAEQSRRQPMAQVASIQDLLEAGEVGLSAEVVQQVSLLCTGPVRAAQGAVLLHAHLFSTARGGGHREFTPLDALLMQVQDRCLLRLWPGGDARLVSVAAPEQACCLPLTLPS